LEIGLGGVVSYEVSKHYCDVSKQYCEVSKQIFVKWPPALVNQLDRDAAVTYCLPFPDC